MFTTANFPGASTGNLTDARSLYGLLTGRITAINGTARLSEDTNRYEYLGPRTERVRLNEIGFFAQDSWRFTPTLTLNYGAALGAAAADAAAQRLVLDVVVRGSLRPIRRSAPARAGAAATSSSPAR